MPFIPLGVVGNVLSAGNALRVDQLLGGTITAQEIVLAGGTQGAIRSQNYDPTNETGWAIFGDGSASFYGDLTIGANAIVLGDVYSINWDGAIPANLATRDGTATAGYYLDSSVGSLQLEGDFWLGGDADIDGNIDLAGDLTLSGSGQIATGTTGEFLTVGAGAESEVVQFWDGATEKFRVGFMGVSDNVGIQAVDDNDIHIIANGTLSSIVYEAESSHAFLVDASEGYDILTLTADYVRLDTGLNGTVSSPALQIAGTNQGFYSPAGAGLALAADGVLIMSWDNETGSGSWAITNEVIYFDKGAVGESTVAGAKGHGIKLHAGGMNTTSQYTPGLFFGSHDSAFGAPRDLVALVGRAKETYAGSGDYGMSLMITTHKNNNSTIFQTAEFWAGYGSGLAIREDLTDVGNHETLRADRTASGTGLTEVGYYSSELKFKSNVTSLVRSPKWKREWFLDLEPVTYLRKATKGREFGFYIENLIEHTNQLTTKGDQVGGSPDEFALLAVTVDYVQHLEERVAYLEDIIQNLVG